MTELRKVLRREIERARDQIRGTVIGNPYATDIDGTGILTYVAPAVDIGSTRLLERVPIKINGPQARLYARSGSPVFLQKNAQGRYQIVSPAERTRKPGNVQLIDEDTGLTVLTGSGFTVTREPYSWYADNGTYANGVDGYPKLTVRDGDGNIVNVGV